jgi:hypothetical protein
VRKLIALAALFAATALAACGGGGGSSPAPTPIATATVAPSSQKHIVFVIHGPGQSTLSSSANLRRVLSTGNALSQEPVEIARNVCTDQSTACGLSVLQHNGATSAYVIPKVVDANGSPVPEPAPTVSVASSIADITTPSPLPSNSPQVLITSNTSTQGATSATFTYPDVSGSVPINVLDNLGLVSIPATDAYSAVGYTYASGSAVATSTASAGDIGVDASGNILFPYGAVAFSSDTPLSSILNGPTSFTGTPITSIPIPTIQANVFQYAIFLAKTSQAAVYLKLRTISMQCQSYGGSGAACGNALFTGLAEVSDSTGTFVR